MTRRMFDSQVAVTVGPFGTHIWDLTLADTTSDKALIVNIYPHFTYFFFRAGHC